jgi:hypothetical protein
MPEPVFVALLLADRVITEDNQKKGIIGTFTQFVTPRLPASFPPWFIYAAATNIVGENPFSIRMVSDETGNPVFSAEGKLNVDNPRKVVELVIPVANAIFPLAGTYTLLFSLDGETLGSRVLEVIQRDRD